MHSLKKGRIEALMGLFSDTNALEQLERRIQQLETLCDDLGRASRSLELEYIELYDKVRHQMSRMAKRGAVEARKNMEPELIEEIDDGVDEISARILAQRKAPRPAA